MKLLSKTPVLDKGYVAHYSSSPSGQDLTDLSREFFRGVFDERLLSCGVMHLLVKCPLFVQMTFPENGLTYIVQRAEAKAEAFIPNVAEVGAQTLEASEAIQKDIQGTTEALLLNPRAYQSENCDLFISQVISPVSVYNTILISGNLTQWMSYVTHTRAPAPIEAYRRAVESVLFAEFPQLKDKKAKK